MDKILVGRTEEKKVLLDALASHESEMVAIIGRRRVGKTFLINTVYKDNIVFEVTGLQNAPKTEQLTNFVYYFSKSTGSILPLKTPSSWLEAFMMLIHYLEQLDSDGKKVVFLDELPWLATHKSGFLRALGFFWNSWAVKQNIVVVICGSAASWMIQKVVNNRGGLYNRVTKRIYLEPFTLKETEAYLKSRNLHFDCYQIVQLYMALGGIPHHLKEIERGKSATQNIDHIFFSKSAPLKGEFLQLYPSLFANAENHIAIIRALSKTWQGMTRKELEKKSKVPEGGTMSRVLEELIHSGFISIYRSFGKKKKEKRYRLTDEYSLFYLKFIEGKEHEGKNIWHHLSQTQEYKIWCGYAFENLCLKHIPQIKKAMDIAGIYSLSSSFHYKGSNIEDGTQIDLLIDRKDQVINLCEIKFYTEPYIITKSYAENLREKRRIFRTITKTNKQLFFIFISIFGLKQNNYSQELIAQDLNVDALFLEE